MSHQKHSKACRYGLLSLAIAVAALLLGYMTPTKWNYHAQSDCTYPAYVSSVNHFHTELMVPVETAAFDWRSRLSLSQLGSHPETYRYTDSDFMKRLALTPFCERAISGQPMP